MKSIIEFRKSLKKKNKDFNPDDIVKKYIEFAKRNITFRSLCEKPNQIKTFGLKDRSGINNETKSEQKEQKEKKLCKALFNTYNYNKQESKTIMRIDGYSQYIVDYETPLKNTDEDKLWGEIDLVGFIQSSPNKHLCFWEVKYGENQDSIHYAVMQLLIYYAQFDRTNNDKAEKNFQNFLLELAFVRGVGLNNNTVTIHQDKPVDTPVLFIAGDEGYFNNQWKSTKTKQRHIELKEVIEKELKLKLEFLQIGTEHHWKKDAKRYYYDKDNELKILT